MQKDKAEKILEDYKDVFADIYNVLMFGEQYLDEKGLEAGPTESIYKAESGKLKEQRRDILKTYRKQNFTICSLGIENQSTIDKYMPLRVMGYDYATYRNQVINKKKILPTITIILNFSDKEWNEPKSLRELFYIPDKLRAFVPDYQIKVYDIAFLPDEVIEKFTSDFRLVAKYLKMCRLGKVDVLADEQQEIKHVEAVLDLFKVFTKDERYEELLTEEIKSMVEKGEKVNMCIVLDTIEQRGIERGIQMGIAQGISQGISQGRLVLLKKWVEKGKTTLEEAAEEMEMTVNQLKDMFDGINTEGNAL